EIGHEERAKTMAHTIMIGEKEFVTYTNAKRIVKLVNDVGSVVNSGPEVNNYLKVVFVPNYNVSVDEIREASSTSNMKFSLNGCLIIETLDGANVEMRRGDWRR
ncbi:hypothetical protein MKX03_012320, partial [Papaver bracteatum]